MPGSGATSQLVPPQLSLKKRRSEEPASSAGDASDQSSESPLRSSSDPQGVESRRMASELETGSPFVETGKHASPEKTVQKASPVTRWQPEQLRTPPGDAPEPRLELRLRCRADRGWGRALRMLVVIDEFTRECLAIEVGRSFTSDGVIGVLQYLFAIRGVPEHIRSDNGPEFVAKGIRLWLVQAGVSTLFIAKSSPWENGYVESFNGKFRDELLNGELFLGLEDARWVIDRWRLDYNHRRPHSALDYQTPAAFAANCVLEDSATLHPPEHRTTTDLTLSH